MDGYFGIWYCGYLLRKAFGIGMKISDVATTLKWRVMFFDVVETDVYAHWMLFMLVRGYCVCKVDCCIL